MKLGKKSVSGGEILIIGLAILLITGGIEIPFAVTGCNSIGNIHTSSETKELKTYTCPSSYPTDLDYCTYSLECVFGGCEDNNGVSIGCSERIDIGETISIKCSNPNYNSLYVEGWVCPPVSEPGIFLFPKTYYTRGENIVVDVRSEGFTNQWISANLEGYSASCLLVGNECSLNFGSGFNFWYGTHVATVTGGGVTETINIEIKNTVNIDLSTPSDIQESSEPIIIYANVYDDANNGITTSVSQMIGKVTTPSGGTHDINIRYLGEGSGYPGNYELSYTTSEIGDHRFTLTVSVSNYVPATESITINIKSGRLDVTRTPANVKLNERSKVTFEIVEQDVLTDVNTIEVVIKDSDGYDRGTYSLNNGIMRMRKGVYTTPDVLFDKPEKWNFKVTLTKQGYTGVMNYLFVVEVIPEDIGGPDWVYIAVVGGLFLIGVSILGKRLFK